MHEEAGQDQEPAGRKQTSMINPSRPRGTISPASRRMSIVWLAALLATAGFLFAKSASAQSRDHLTEQESELVRFNQSLDKRIDVFIRAINLRFAIINGTAAPPKPKKSDKEEPDWGDPPKGTRAELLGDIAGILDEAITNIDDVSRRDEKSPLLSRSLRKLTAATNGYLHHITTLKTQSKDPDELPAIIQIA